MADLQSIGAHLLPQLEELLRDGIPETLPQDLLGLLSRGYPQSSSEERVFSYLKLLVENGELSFFSHEIC